MTSSGLGFIDEQLEDGGGLFSPGSTTTPSINSVNTNSVEKLTANGNIWVYDSSENKVDVKTADIQTINSLSGSEQLTEFGQLWTSSYSSSPLPTATVRISPTENRIYSTTGHFDLFQDVNSSIFKLKSTRDAQVQLTGDMNNSSPIESGSVFVSSNGGASKGYFGIDEYFTLKPLTIVAEGSATAGIQMYVSTADFITTESANKPDPTNKPLPAMVIDSANIPTFGNGLSFGQETLDSYREFQVSAQFITDPFDVNLSPNATLYFTAIGRIVHCTVSLVLDADASLGSAEAIVTTGNPVPFTLRPIGGVTASGPARFTTAFPKQGPYWVVLTNGNIRITAGDDGDFFDVNTISIRQTLTWTC